MVDSVCSCQAGLGDGFYSLVDGGFDILIGQVEVVDTGTAGGIYLFLCGGKATSNQFFGFTFAGAKAREEFIFTWGQDKDAEGIRDLRFDLNGALYIDFEDDKAAAFELLDNPGFGRAVLFAVDTSVFEKLIGGFHPLKLFIGDEVVIDPFDIGVGAGASGGGDGENGVGDAAFYAACDGGFAHARGAADDEDETVVRIRLKAMAVGIVFGVSLS